MKRSLAATLILLIGGALVLTTVKSATADVPTFKLHVGESKGWDGEYVDIENGDGCENCVWQLDTSDGGSRLRVALDLLLDYRKDTKDEGVHPDASSGRSFKLQIFDERGDELANTTQGTGYSIELFLCFDKPDGEPCEPFQFDNGIPCNPAGDFRCEATSAFATASLPNLGKWTVKVIPDGDDILGWTFRMRAKLEGAPSTAQNKKLQLPNLRAIPPFELTFCEPLVTAGFLVGKKPVCGSDSNGLTDGEEADLIADDAPSGTIKLHRALRFSTGPENVGDGFVEIRTHPGNVVLPDPDDPNTFTLRHVAFQRFYKPDGTPVYKADGITPDDREVGTMEFHQAHGHWHYQFFIYELYELTRTDPTEPWKKIKLGARTVGKKVGFCPSDEHLADFSRFYQLRRNRWIDDRFEEDPALLPFQFLGGNCISPDRPMMGITPGWGDLYEWARVEQFVEFPIKDDGTPRDGYYLLRATVDATLDEAGSLAAGPLLESNEKDNTSYAFFNVTNGAIKIIRSGYGLEP